MVIVKDEYEELFQRNMDTTHGFHDRSARLEVAFHPGHFNLCLHYSHVVVEAVAAMIGLNHFLERLVDGNPDRVEYERLVSINRDPQEVLNSLPVSTASAYQTEYKPTPEEEQKGIDHWDNILQMHVKVSIAT